MTPEDEEFARLEREARMRMRQIDEELVVARLLVRELGDRLAKLEKPWVGLTDEEIQQGYETTGHYQTLRPQDKFAVYALARAIEAKLKEKNT